MHEPQGHWALVPRATPYCSATTWQRRPGRSFPREEAVRPTSQPDGDPKISTAQLRPVDHPIVSLSWAARRSYLWRLSSVVRDLITEASPVTRPANKQTVWRVECVLPSSRARFVRRSKLAFHTVSYRQTASVCTSSCPSAACRNGAYTAFANKA